MLFDLQVSMNKWSLICSTFLGIINLLHSTSLFVFLSSRYHTTFQLFCHLILVLWSNHFSFMEQMLNVKIKFGVNERLRAVEKSSVSYPSKIANR